MRGLSIASLASIVFLVGLVQAAGDPSADQGIKEAITLLEARKAKAANKADQDKLGAAIAALEKLVGKKADAPKAAADAGEITPAMLKKKFAGRAAFNPKTKELTLIYDFKDKDQLKDFDLGDVKPTVKAGVARIGAADSIKHVAKFKTLKVTGQFFLENIGSGERNVPFIGAFPSVSIQSGALNGAYFVLVANEKHLGSKAVGRNQIERTWIPTTLTMTERRANAKIHSFELAGPTNGEGAYQVELSGGLGGMQVRAVVISGVPDEEWAEAFFAK